MHSVGEAIEYILDGKVLEYRESSGVYPVREDTLLLIDEVLPLLGPEGGSLLDMGCGTGLLSLISASRGWETHSCDREPEALWLTRENLCKNGKMAIFHLSDLFSGIPRGYLSHFDLITFNPPYLSDIPTTADPRFELALNGGSMGLSVAISFLGASWRFLSERGKVIMLVPHSITYQDLSQFEKEYPTLDLKGTKTPNGEGLMMIEAGIK